MTEHFHDIRILQILPELNVGGVETGTVDLAKYLKGHGYFSVVVSNGGSLVPELENEGIAHYEIPVHKKNIFVALGCVKKLREIIVKERITIVHARSRVPAWIAFFACRHTQAQFLTTCHGHYSVNAYSRIMAFPKKIIVPSHVIGRHMIEQFHYASDKIHYIPRSVDLDRFPFRGIDNISVSRPVITIVGRLTPLKGHAFFLKAMAKVVRSLPYARIRIVGSAPKKKESYLQELKVLTRHLGLDDHVEFLGSRRDIPSIVKDSDVLVMSSIVPEAFGRVILEAQAVGVPVVATKIGGALEIIEDEKTGLLVLPRDTDAMAKAVIRVLNDKPLARQLLSAARRRIEEVYTLDHMASQTVAVYEELTEEQNILVIKMGALGDVILATASFKALRECFPKAKICCLVGADCKDVIQTNRRIDELIIADFKGKHKGILGLWRLGRKLREYHFDKVIDFQNSTKSHLLAWFSCAEHIYGYKRKLGFFVTDPVKDPRHDIGPVEHQFQVLKMLGLDYDPAQRLELSLMENDKKRVDEILRSEWISQGMRVVGIHVSASEKWRMKNWPADRIGQVCDILAQKNIRVILTGAITDRARADEILRYTRSKPAVLVGKTSVIELAGVIARCDVLLTPDSSPMHIAAAVGTPFVALFGPTDPKRHVPPADRKTVIVKDMDCLYCYNGQLCKTFKHACMERIEVAEVIEAIEKLLGSE